MANNKVYQTLSFKNEKGVITVFPDVCKGCGLCIEVCPKKVIIYNETEKCYLGTPTVKVEIDGCIFCFLCEQNCPDCSIRVEKNDHKE